MGKVLNDRVAACTVSSVNTVAGGLVSAGLDNTIAVPAVFMYRLFTFRAPIVPGWISFRWLQRNEYI
jgi:hypothetical protein